MFDALTLTAVVDEVRPLIRHGRIQRVLLLDDLSIGIEVYADHRRHQLLVSAHPRDARLHLVSARLTSDRERVTPFLLLLRKYARGGIVLDVTQPPLERTVALSIAKRLPLDKAAAGALAAAHAADDGQTATEDDDQQPAELDDAATYEVVVTLYVEIMGRHSNIVLVDGGGVILDSVKRVPASVNRYRTVLPRRPYVPPPPQAKADPRQVDASWWRRLQERTPATAALPATLVAELRGVSPQLARELAARIAGRVDSTLADVPDAAAAAQAVSALFGALDRHDWAPHIYRRDGRVVAYSPIPLTSLTDLVAEPSASMSAVVEAGIGQTAAVTGHGQSKAQLVARLSEERTRVAARRAALADQLATADDADRWRVAGELVLGFQHSLTPGQSRLDVGDVAIDLDPSLSAVANAQAYFDRYRRARAAAAAVPERLAQTELDLEYLDNLIVFARQAETLADVHALEAEWQARAAPAGRPARRPPARAPRRLRFTTGERLLIGRNGRQNDDVTFMLAGPDDLWLHARGLPGAHVILQPRPGQAEPPARLIEAAAQLAAYYSPARDATAVEVDITARRWVRKIKGGPPGLVTYRQETTVRVAPADEASLVARGLLARAPGV